MGDVVAERLGEELVGGGQFLFGVAEQDAGAVVVGRPGRLRHHRGLAQTRFPETSTARALAGGHPLGRVGNGRQLVSRPTTPTAGRTARRRERDGRPARDPSSEAPTTPRWSRPARAGPSAPVLRPTATRAGCADRPWPHDVGGQDLAAPAPAHRAGPPPPPGPRSSRRPPG